MDCLYDLQETGYQVGTGVMIGLPFQTLQDLAGDLLFMQQFDIDMIGMGPYLEHENTPFMLIVISSFQRGAVSAYTENDCHSQDINEGCEYCRHHCIAGH